MTKKVRPEDFALYLKKRVIPLWKEKYTTSFAIFEEKKKKYESRWFAKLLNLKYEGSYRDAMWGFEHERYERWIEDTSVYVAEIEYHTKTNQEFMDFPSDLSIEKFYVWCSNNNIPY